MSNFKLYTIEYRMYESDIIHTIEVLSNNKESAYIEATYSAIPEKEKELAYSVWVTGVTYKNGNYKAFNTFEGNPY